MTRTSDSFGALALTVLTVFALWTSTLTMPAAADASSSADQTGQVVSSPALA